MLAILNLVGEQLDVLYKKLLDRTAGDRVELARLAPTKQRLAESLRENLARLAALQAEGPATGRRMGEHDLPEDQVRRRRATEHERRLRYLRKRVTELRKEIETVEVDQQGLEARLQLVLMESVALGNRWTGWGDLRLARYIKGVCVSHPDLTNLIHAATGFRAQRREWLDLSSARDLMTYIEEAAA